MKNEEFDKIYIINDTKIKSTNETWIIIGGEKKWIRKCPDCGEKMLYSHSASLYRSIKRNCKCINCERKYRYSHTDASSKISKTLKGRIFSESHKRKLSLKLRGENNPMYGKTGKLNPFFNKKHKKETKIKIGQLSTKCNTGRKHSVETIKLWRKLSIERKKKLGIFNNQPFYNPIACKFIEEFGKNNGYNFQHALNGGEFYVKELEYWVDGYDKNKNVVIEYNEPHHYDINGNLKEKDIRRLIEIKNLLNCKFIVYNGHSKSIEIL